MSLSFNLYSKYIFQELLREVQKDIKVNDIWINNIHYADDMVLIDTVVIKQYLNLVTNKAEEWV